MIDVVYRIKVAPGKAGQALGWAKKHLAYVRKAGLSAQAMSVVQPRTGETDEIAWVDRYPSMAVYEENRHGKGPADSGWVASLKELTEAEWYRGVETTIYDVVDSVG